jgi:hypothetical protein
VSGISGPVGITAGRDGALWFINNGNNSIGRITTAGTVTNYTGTGISSPKAIAAGPDGALWFTDGNSSIGRITTTGTVTSYSGTGVSGPQGIVAGRDGAMWFTSQGNSSIGRITTNMISNSSFAGYQAAVTAGSATSSAAKFTVPKLSCTSAARAIAPSAGVEVNSYKTFSAAFLFTGCVAGKAGYFPGVVINGTETDFTATAIKAGDVINLSTTVTTSGTTVQVTDVTTGVTNKLIGAGASSDAAYTGDSGWYISATTLAGVPNFGTLSFTNCLIDLKTLASRDPAEYLRATKAGTVQIAPGALSTAGTAFSTYYNHS